MGQKRLLTAFPYILLLAVAAWFYHIAMHIQYTARPGELGPDFWPRLVLAMLMVICAIHIGRVLIFGAGETAGVAGEDAEEGEAPRQLFRLGLGIAVTVAYGALITIFGFPLTTAAFMILFVYAGGYARHLPIWLSSLAGAVILTVLFRSLVYVSLPRGVPPFDAITDILMKLF